MFCFVVLSISETVWLQMMIEKGVFAFFKSGCCEGLVYKYFENTVSEGLGVSKCTGRSHFISGLHS